MMSCRFDSAGRPNSSEDELEASGKDGENRPDDDDGVGGALVPAREWHVNGTSAPTGDLGRGFWPGGAKGTGTPTPCSQSTPGLSETVAHLVLRHDRIRWDRPVSGPVVASLGGRELCITGH
jgi:hypothetical protein